MGTEADLEQALQELTAGPVEIHEGGRRVPGASRVRFEVHRRGGRTLVHLWSDEQNLVRRVLSVAERGEGRIVLEVERFGRRHPGRLEIIATDRERTPQRLTREQFLIRFQEILGAEFPDDDVESLTTSPDLEHSLSGCFARGILRSGARRWAVLGASSAEDAPTLDGILTFGLIWLDRVRGAARAGVIAGLRLFLPRGTTQITAHRLRALEPSTAVELYAIDETLERVKRVDAKDAGNLITSLTPRREVEGALAAAEPALKRILALAPEAITASVPPGTREVALRFRGIEFARWRDGKVLFGIADERNELTPGNFAGLKRLVRELARHRSAAAREPEHALYRMQAERWLEAQVAADPQRIDPRLDPSHLYAQVPAFAAGDRGVIDLLGVTRDGRLAVMELKANEDIHLPLQAVDYWLRVRWHLEQNDFRRYGYFPGIELQVRPPLLYLVAPSLRFHPSSDVVLRHLSSEIEVTRVGLNENWREGVQVVLRQGWHGG